MCGPSSAQKSALASDQALGQELTNSYTTDFQESQGLFQELSDNLSSIVEAGPSQMGYSPEETAAMNSQAINAAAASNKNIQAAIGEKAGAVDTANPGVESGVTQAVRAGAESQVENNLQNQEEGITIASAKQGNENYESAVKAQEELPGATMNPVSAAANPVNQANKNIGTQSEQNEEASSSWEGLLGGLAGGFVKGLAGGIGSGSKGDGSSGPNLSVPSGFDPSAGDYLNED